jgi:hypothetical protein
MAFAQWRTIRAEDERMMGKGRRLPTESLVEEDLTGGIGKMIISSNHMGDVHQIVIDDASEIVSCHSVRPDNDKIADSFRIEGHSPMHKVIKGDGASFHMKSKDGRLAL